MMTFPLNLSDEERQKVLGMLNRLPLSCSSQRIWAELRKALVAHQGEFSFNEAGLLQEPQEIFSITNCALDLSNSCTGPVSILFALINVEFQALTGSGTIL